MGQFLGDDESGGLLLFLSVVADKWGTWEPSPYLSFFRAVVAPLSPNASLGVAFPSQSVSTSRLLAVNKITQVMLDSKCESQLKHQPCFGPSIYLIPLSLNVFYYICNPLSFLCRMTVTESLFLLIYFLPWGRSNFLMFKFCMELSSWGYTNTLFSWNLYLGW